MPNDTTRIEIITGRERRCRYTANEKLVLVDATKQPGMTVSAVARLCSPAIRVVLRVNQDGCAEADRRLEVALP